MSFKDGIPLLTTLDDEDASDEDFTVELTRTTRHRWGRKHLLFGLGVGLVVFVVVALIVAITVPVVLLQGGGGSKTGGSTGASETTSISPSTTLSMFSSVSSPITPTSSTKSISRSTTLSLSSSVSTSSSSQVPSSTSSSQVSPTPSPSPSPNILNNYKPTSDDREYDFLVLSNSLRVVLISDTNSNVSAAAMEVAAGSFSDPPDAEGLAHFCEHMLFLGTEKYPNDHEYSNYLTAHGGGDNAFTSTQETNYYFTVDSKFLEKALDLFAQFFIAPLFRNTSVADEVHAVNAEHEKNLQADPWKIWQLLKHVSNPLHPFHQFSTGTLYTLNNTNLLELLKHYYRSSYSANTMQLVVYGKDPLPTLASWVRTYFTDIPNRHISPKTFTATAFPPQYSGKLVYFYPVADVNLLSLIWQTTPLEPRYRNDVVEFLSRYLGYEGLGSILQHLKNESLAVSISVGSEIDADSFTLFVVGMELTEKGLGRVPDIVRTVFQFISLLSNQSESEMRTLWDNHVTASQVVFDHSEPETPHSYATHISQKMRITKDAPDFLGDPGRFVFNYTLINSVLEAMTPENMVGFLGTHHVNFSSSGLGPEDSDAPDGPPEQDSSSVAFPWPDLDQLEPIYSTPYTEMDIPTELLSYWGDLTPVSDDLFLQETNDFIPRDFGILPPPPNPSDTPAKVDVDGNGVSLWLLQDTTFNTPHINMYCSIEAAQPDVKSVRWSELTTLYTQLAVEVLTPVLYPAGELTYSMGLFPSPKGLRMSFSGFSDPTVMANYISSSVRTMTDYAAMKSVFDIVREKRQDYLENYKYTNHPYLYISSYLQQVVMERPYWKHEEQLAVVDDVTLTVDDIIEHAKTLFTGASFLCFAHGNINETKAVQYTRLVVDTLSPSPSSHPSPSGGHQSQRVNLTDPGTYTVTLPTLNPNDQNSAVEVVFQVGPACTDPDSPSGAPCSEDYLTATAHLGLINHLIGDQCFYQLRTVEQLGYVAFCFQTTYSGIASFQVVVQSQEYNASYVLGEINQFLQNFEDSTIATFTDEKLSSNKELYARKLRKKSQTLRDESSRLWSEILDGREQFDYNDQILQALDSISLNSLRQFYRRHITDSSQFKKLVIGVYSEDKPVDLSQESSYCIDWDSLDHSLLDYTATNSNCSTLTL